MNDLATANQFTGQSPDVIGSPSNKKIDFAENVIDVTELVRNPLGMAIENLVRSGMNPTVERLAFNAPTGTPNTELSLNSPIHALAETMLERASDDAIDMIAKKIAQATGAPGISVAGVGTLGPIEWAKNGIKTISSVYDSYSEFIQRMSDANCLGFKAIHNADGSKYYIDASNSLETGDVNILTVSADGQWSYNSTADPLYKDAMKQYGHPMAAHLIELQQAGLTQIDYNWAIEIAASKGSVNSMLYNLEVETIKIGNSIEQGMSLEERQNAVNSYLEKARTYMENAEFLMKIDGLSEQEAMALEEAQDMLIQAERLIAQGPEMKPTEPSVTADPAPAPGA